MADRLAVAGLQDEARAIILCASAESVKNCDGRLELEAVSDLAPETIPADERAGTAQIRLHRIAARCYCGRPWCPGCGEYGSPSHSRRANRLQDQIGKVRLGKWVITLSEEDRALIDGREDVEEMMGQIAEVTMRVHGVPASKVAVHWMGDLTQGIHFEDVFPHHGRRESKRDLQLFREELAIAMGLQHLPTAKFIFVDLEQDPEVQWRMNKQRTRYMMHPTIPAWRLVELGDGELRALVEMRTRFETCRGFGLWSKKKVRTPEAAALARSYPMPPKQERRARGSLRAGDPCPIEECCAPMRDQGLKPSRPGGKEIAPGIFVHEFVVTLSDIPDAISRARTRCQPIVWREHDAEGKEIFRPAKDLPPHPWVKPPIVSTNDPRFIKMKADLHLSREPGEDLEDADVYAPEGGERHRHARILRWMLEEEWRSRWRHANMPSWGGAITSIRVKDLGDVGRSWDLALWDLYSRLHKRPSRCRTT